MKKISFIILAAATLASCGSKNIDTNQLKGKWTLEDINHPMFEDDYKNRKKNVDTMSVVDLGTRAYFQSDNLDSIKMSLNKMIDEEYEMMKGTFMDLAFDFIDDSTVLRISRNASDTNHYKIVEGNLILNSLQAPADKLDTLFVETATADKLVLKERFLKSFVTLKLKK